MGPRAPTVLDHGLILPETPPGDPGGPGTVTRLLETMAEHPGNGPVLVGRGGRLGSDDLGAAVAREVDALRGLGVGRGDRVAVSLPNDVDVVISFLATASMGAIWVGINRTLAPPEKTYLLGDCGASVLVTDADSAAELEPSRGEVPDLGPILVVGSGEAGTEWTERRAGADPSAATAEIDPLDPAAIAYTSGTTGRPKGAVHTHHNLLLPGTVSRRRDQYPGGGVLGVPLPLTILNLIVLGPLMAFQNDLTLVAMDRIDAVGVAEWVAAERITTFAAVPAMVHDLLTHPDVDEAMLDSLEGIGVGGADMPEAFRRMYAQRFGRPVGTGYGLTEAPTAVTIEDPDEAPVPDTCGKALPQVTIHVLDEDDRPCRPGMVGEVCVGPATEGPFADCWRPMLGYWDRPDASAAALRDGLLHTGDLGTLDADDHLFIKDRRHDLIIRGGANVYPAEVERVLHDDDRVQACAVVGLADDRLGERVVAFVQLGDGATATGAELRDRCRGHLAAYKVPDTITFVAGFERTPMGKIQKAALRAEPTGGG